MLGLTLSQIYLGHALDGLNTDHQFLEEDLEDLINKLISIDSKRKGYYCDLSKQNVISYTSRSFYDLKFYAFEIVVKHFNLTLYRK